MVKFNEIHTRIDTNFAFKDLKRIIGAMLSLMLLQTYKLLRMLAFRPSGARRAAACHVTVPWCWHDLVRDADIDH